jgi:subtilisin family serine protease
MKRRYRCKNKLRTIDNSNSTSIFLGSAIIFLAFILVATLNNHAYYAFAQNETSDTEEEFFSLPENITVGKPIPGQFIVSFLNDTMNDSFGSTPMESVSTSMESVSTLANDTEGLQVINTLPNLGILIVNGSQEAIASLAVKADDEGSTIVTEQNKVVGMLQQTLPTGIDRVDAESNMENNTANNNSVNATIGILDTGIDLTNTELNVIDDVSFIPEEPTGQDGQGHGTHVAGITAAKDNGVGVIGIAPGAKLVAIKVLSNSGSGSTATVLAGLEYALEHADELDVVNLSLGGPGSSVATDIAITKLVNAGVPVVVAAGNDHSNAGWFTPANSPDAWTVSSITDTDGKCGQLGDPIIRMGVTIPDDSFSPFSNYGSVVDFAAPGQKILSTVPNGEFKEFSGTSMATPHVAGAVALYKSMNPNASPSQIFDALVSMANNPGINCDISENNGYAYIENWDRDFDDIREPLLYIGNSNTIK